MCLFCIERVNSLAQKLGMGVLPHGVININRPD